MSEPGVRLTMCARQRVYSSNTLDDYSDIQFNWIRNSFG